MFDLDNIDAVETPENDLEEVVMGLIINSGQARSLAYGALKQAKQGDFAAAKAMMEQSRQALSEAHRVLKTGGRFLCLEFSDVQMPILDKLYEFHSFHVIPRIGKLVAGDDQPYQYLVESIRKFPKQEAFAAMIRHAGFERVSYRNLTGGVAAMHSGWKI